MLIISECRFCNADKTTCPIKQGMSERLRVAGIKDRLKYRCKEWTKHRKYQVGDWVVFHFIERSSESGYRAETSGETITGQIVDVSKKKPIYFVQFDAEGFAKIDPAYTGYGKYVIEMEDYDEVRGLFKTGFYQAPVRESLIMYKTEQPCNKH
jgi:hypothetical protein